MSDPIRAIDTPPAGESILSRGALKKSPEKRIDRDAEPNGAILGLSVITGGAPLGRYAWIDGEFLDQVVKFGNAGKGRIKSRFTHPDMSSDGLGKQLGRMTNFRRNGDQILADEHFLAAASEAPEGDLAGYVMKLTEEAPEDFGTSIVFYHDRGAEDRFLAEHTDEEGTFTSPDPANEKNLPHWRLRALDAVDVVDEPAANPSGMFSRTSAFVTEAEQVASYALGLTDDMPERALFDKVHPERARRFVSGFLARRGLAIVDKAPERIPAAGKDGAMAPELKDVTVEQLEAERPDIVGQLKALGGEEEAAKADAAKTEDEQSVEDQLAAARAEGAKAEGARLAALKEAFPERTEFALEQFEAGASLDEARAALRGVEIKELKAENAKLKKVVEGTAPVGFAGQQDGEKSHLEQAKEYQAEHECTITEALKKTAPQRR